MWVKFETSPGSYWLNIDNNIQNIIVNCELVKSNKHFEHIFYL